MNKVTPQIMALIMLETEILYMATLNKSTKIFTHFLAGTLYYEKLKNGYKLIYKPLTP